MFAQVIQGKVSDPAKVRAAMDQWVQAVAPGATGWLGTTGGVRDDGTLIAVVRFESEEAARANSARPEQDQWWAETSRLFDGEVSFVDSSDVIHEVFRDPDQARFVQVLRGKVSNLERIRELMTAEGPARSAFRPDILANVAVLEPDGSYTLTVYFDSEEAARAGETKETPEALLARRDEIRSLQAARPDFFDLRDPWLVSAG